MRFLLLVDSYVPSQISSAKLMHDLAVELCSREHEVLVLTPDSSIKDKFKIDVVDGVEVMRLRSGPIKNVSKVRRLINESLLSYNMWRASKDYLAQRQFDCIVPYTPTIFFGPLIDRLRKLWGCPSYLILRDIFPQWAVDSGLLRKGLLYLYFKYFEKRLYDSSNIVAIQSPANMEYFRSNNLQDTYSFDVLFNWASSIPNNLPSHNFRDSLGLSGKTVFFYGGNIGIAQDMDNLLRLAKSTLSEEKIHYLWVGQGSEYARVESAIKEQSLSNVTLLPAVGQDEYLSMLLEFDVGLISLDKRLKTQNIPGKLMGYAAVGMPVVASINPGNDLRDILEEYKVGFVFENGQDQQFADSVKVIARDEALRAEMGENSKKLSTELFSVEKAATQIESFFKQLGCAPVDQQSDEDSRLQALG